MAFLSRRFHVGLRDTEDRWLGSRGGPSGLFEMGLYVFPNAATKIAAAEEETPSLRDWFSDAGILVCRPRPSQAGGLGAAIVGCHNDKPHNHNDIGTFVVALGHGTPRLDPGSETYTGAHLQLPSLRQQCAQLLRPQRAAGGRPVAADGPAAAARVVRSQFTEKADTLVLDIRSAYPVKSLKKLTLDVRLLPGRIRQPHGVR